jgi:hypothetical protein
MIAATLLSIATCAGLLAYRQLRRRNLERWLVSYLLAGHRRRLPRKGEPVHLLLCIADHYEPKLGNAPPGQAQARVNHWVQSYPQLFGSFRDSDGRPPRHTFFYPIEDYEPEYLDALAELCHAGYGEVEIHLHHNADTAENLCQNLMDAKNLLAHRHGLLSRRRGHDDVLFGFIHGNWALDNSLPDGHWCGVNNELEVLREAGCYADFTLPSAPSPAQTRKINSLYYAQGRPGRCKSHDTGVDVGFGPAPPDSLLLIQGPLLLDWSKRKWHILPRIENACLQGSQPPTLERLLLWLRARVQVPARPDWFFVKLHTHGASEANQKVLLGEPMLEFHRALARRAADDPAFHFHYVTAREIYNLVLAAEAGWPGTVADARDFSLIWNGGTPIACEPDFATRARSPIHAS